MNERENLLFQNKEIQIKDIDYSIEYKTIKEHEINGLSLMGWLQYI